jgi:pyridoxal 5'-phosphate synthase pdxS subunit
VRCGQGTRRAYAPAAEVARAGRLPVVLVTAGGVATPADSALMAQPGAEGVVAGSGHLRVRRPGQARRHRQGRTFHDYPDVAVKVSRGLGQARIGINLDTLPSASIMSAAPGNRRP